MTVRAALLSIPAPDPAASSAVCGLLRAALGEVVVLHDAYAAGSRNWIEETLRRWCDEEEIDLVVTIGGTMPAPGHSGEERTPEATEAVIERRLPGLPEAMRAYAQEESSLALLDRSTAGIRGRTLILNLPAGAKAATLFLEAVVDVVGPLLAYLDSRANAPTLEDDLSYSAEDASVESSPSPDDLRQGPRKGLDAGEFAEFLRRKQDRPPAEPDHPPGA